MRKSRLALGSLVFALATAFAAPPTVAAERRTLTVPELTLLQGTEIPLGQYSLTWKATGAPDEYALTVHSGRKVLATATGRKVTLDSPSLYDSLVYLPGEAGRSLVEIRFAGKTEAIRIEPRAEASLH